MPGGLIGRLRLTSLVWRAHWLGLGVVAWVGLVSWGHAVGIPGRDIAEYLTPLAPLPYAVTTVISRQPLVEWAGEVRSPRRPRRRLVHSVASALGACCTAALCSAVFDATPSSALRNFAFFIGVTLLLPDALDEAASVGLVLYSCAAWLIGSNGSGTEPDRWALPLAAPTSLTAATISGAIALCGLCRFTGALPGRLLRSGR